MSKSPIQHSLPSHLGYFMSRSWQYVKHLSPGGILFLLPWEPYKGRVKIPTEEYQQFKKSFESNGGIYQIWSTVIDNKEYSQEISTKALKHLGLDDGDAGDIVRKISSFYYRFLCPAFYTKELSISSMKQHLDAFSEGDTVYMNVSAFYFPALVAYGMYLEQTGRLSQEAKNETKVNPGAIEGPPKRNGDNSTGNDSLTGARVRPNDLLPDFTSRTSFNNFVRDYGGNGFLSRTNMDSDVSTTKALTVENPDSTGSNTEGGGTPVLTEPIIYNVGSVEIQSFNGDTTSVVFFDFYHYAQKRITKGKQVEMVPAYSEDFIRRFQSNWKYFSHKDRAFVENYYKRMADRIRKKKAKVMRSRRYRFMKQFVYEDVPPIDWGMKISYREVMQFFQEKKGVDLAEINDLLYYAGYSKKDDRLELYQVYKALASRWGDLYGFMIVEALVKETQAAIQY